MFLRMLRSMFVAAGCVVVVKSVPDIARYLRIREPEVRPVPGTGGVRNG